MLPDPNSREKASSLYQRGDSFFEALPRQQITISVTTIDSVLKSEGIEFVDFAKFEMNLLTLANYEIANPSDFNNLILS
jgi:hypothetical protein